MRQCLLYVLSDAIIKTPLTYFSPVMTWFDSYFIFRVSFVLRENFYQVSNDQQLQCWWLKTVLKVLQISNKLLFVFLSV